VTFANLASTGQLLVRRIDGVEELFELYPNLAAGTYTVLRPDGVGQLGFVVNSPNPRDCGSTRASTPREGYDGTKVRATVGPVAAAAEHRRALHCVVQDRGQCPRCGRTLPAATPISTPSDTRAYPRVATANTVRVGTTDGSGSTLGDRSWIAMLTDGLY